MISGRVITTRRSLLLGGAGLAIAAGTASAGTIEARFRLAVRRYDVPMAGWGDRPPLTICIVADVHAGEPFMPMGRVEQIVEAANALRPDLHVILGDLPAHSGLVTRRLDMDDVCRALAQLHAPLGRFAVLGNHDWWDDPRYRDPLRRHGLDGPPVMHARIERAGVPVLANAARLLPHGPGVWIAGTDSAWIYRRDGYMVGADDLGATLAQMPGEAPAVLLAHEPDLFPTVPPRIGLTLCGHTHGGQVRLFGHSPVVPSRYGNRYAYGLVTEGGRRLVTSGGLGCSQVPFRLGVPPELTLVTLSRA